MRNCRVCGQDKDDYCFEKTSSGYRKVCRKCKYAAHKVWVSKNKEHVRAKAKEWVENNRESVIAYASNYRAVNREALREANRNRTPEQRERYNAARAEKRKLTPEFFAAKQKESYLKFREKRIASMKQYAIDKPEAFINKSAKIRARAQEACVSWDKELTDFVVEEAGHLRKLRNEMTNTTWHIDHPIPLKGKLVSGLHVYNNIAVIPERSNRTKSNRYDPNKEQPSWRF